MCHLIFIKHIVWVKVKILYEAELYYLIRIQSNCKNVNVRKTRNNQESVSWNYICECMDKYIVKHRFARGIAGYMRWTMNRKAKQVSVCSIHFPSKSLVALYDCSRSATALSSFYIRIQATLANKIKPQQTKRAN